MNTKLLSITLGLLTIATIGLYPTFDSGAAVDPQPPAPSSVNRIDVVFALDTTSSMSGMIEAAKQKIWSIATTLAQTGQVPEIRMGLVAFRDRGDEFVTQVTDLTTDLDSVYATLMSFAAIGGGDGPESVNAALHDAVNEISWSQDAGTYKVLFLVGDAPPHMDYAGEPQFPEILAAARRRNVIVNTIQCGQSQETLHAWNRIAQLGGGRYLQVEQDGSAIALESPFDAEIAELSATLEQTRITYGSAEERARIDDEATRLDALLSAAPVATRARRGVFNASEAGRANLFGERDVVEDFVAGNIGVAELTERAEELPASLQAQSPAELERFFRQTDSKRSALRQRISDLAEQREAYLAEKVEREIADADRSLDRQLYDTIREQAAPLGIVYEDGPSF